MRVLLDTHAFLWLMVDDPRLSVTAKTTFTNVANEIYLSLASAWEMAIKSSLQKIKLPLPVKDYIITRSQAHQIKLLNINLDHLAIVEALPLHHRDPFDRLLIAQSIFETLTILFDDQFFDSYSIQRIW
ncbi:type II toxin-antitoxin system VapC family toxin [candidate division KSB1 bacterium]|nr:type II toxin-antitoxin system VapC family toxin [candidate division KSB1 bacterium]